MSWFERRILLGFSTGGQGFKPWHLAIVSTVKVRLISQIILLQIAYTKIVGLELYFSKPVILHTVIRYCTKQASNLT